MELSPDIEHFASAYRSSKRVINLARQRGRSERDKLDRRRSINSELQRSTAVVYHRWSSSCVYSTIQSRGL